MSWHFSRALVEEFSALGVPPESCARWKSTRTAERSSFDGKKRASLSRSRSGMTQDPFGESRGVGLWISSLRDSRASHSPAQVVGASRQQACGTRPSESSTKLDRDSSCLRMFRLVPSMATLIAPEFPPPAWVPHIAGRDGGYLPTPTTRANQQSPSMLKWPAYRRLAVIAGGKRLPMQFWEWMMGWPIGWTDLEPLETDRYQAWCAAFGS